MKSIVPAALVVVLQFGFIFSVAAPSGAPVIALAAAGQPTHLQPVQPVGVVPASAARPASPRT